MYRKLPNFHHFKSSTISSAAKTQGTFLERKNAEREKVVFKSKNIRFNWKKKEIHQHWKARNIITMAADGSKKASLQTSLHDSNVDNEGTRKNALFNFSILYWRCFFSFLFVQSQKEQIWTFLACKFEISDDTEKTTEPKF